VPTFCHSDDACIGSHHQHAEIGGVTSHAKYGSLEVLLVSCEVNKGDDLGGSLADVYPVQAPCGGDGGKEEGLPHWFVGSYPLLEDHQEQHTYQELHTIITTYSPCPSVLFTTLPMLSNPRMSLPTLEVLPDSISCLWRNSFCRAIPRPLSSSPWVSTPSSVLFPASTFPNYRNPEVCKNRDGHAYSTYHIW